MTMKTTFIPIGILVVAALTTSVGCQPILSGPNFGLLMNPVPVSPYFQKKLEDAAWNHKRYDRSPILGPIQPGAPCVAMDTPSDDEVMRALEKARAVQGGFPFLHEVHRDHVRIVCEPVADYVDPPRVVPLIGPAQLHHAHYKCIVYFTETRREGWPIPYTTVDEDTQEVVYVDHDHFHMVGNVDPGQGSGYPNPVPH